MGTIVRRTRAAVAVVFIALLAASLTVLPSSAKPVDAPTDRPSEKTPSDTTPADKTPSVTAKSYTVHGVKTRADRNQIARTGAAIDSVGSDRVDVSATPAELKKIQALGFTTAEGKTTSRAGVTVQDFPSADSDYHNYAEMITEINALVAANPTIAAKSSIGSSYEGRDLPVIKISDNVATDEAEPEVLYFAHVHAREHLTVEMALYMLHLYLDNYGTDARITNVVDSREIWIIPDMNPDGGEYDIASGTYKAWRKNRQPNSGSSNVGTDLNRNWSYQWGCCGGSSGNTSSETYRGPSAFSAPENVNLRNFINGRVVGGVQQIKTSISWHSYSQLVLWPYSYTTADTAANMSVDQHNALAALGTQLAATNGYTPQQGSDLYLSDGDSIDWEWATHKIFAYTFEMYPGPNQGTAGFYPPDEVIPAETARNREAVLQLAEYADCPYRVIGKQAQYCGAPAPTTVFSDTFETANGWTTNPNGTDTAATGQWERGVPQATSDNGVKQLGTPVSGTTDLVTGRLAGSSAGAYDIDGGKTSVRSPTISLPATGTLSLSLSQYLAYGSNSSNADYLRVSVVANAGTTVVYSRVGAAANGNGVWATASADLTPYAGQSIKILIEAADAAGASLVEAGVDNVLITQS